MTIKHVNEHYGLNIKKGQRVEFFALGTHCDGTITSADHSIIVKSDHFKGRRFRFHPRSEYLNLNPSGEITHEHD